MPDPRISHVEGDFTVNLVRDCTTISAVGAVASALALREAHRRADALPALVAGTCHAIELRARRVARTSPVVATARRACCNRRSASHGPRPDQARRWCPPSGPSVTVPLAAMCPALRARHQGLFRMMAGGSVTVGQCALVHSRSCDVVVRPAWEWLAPCWGGPAKDTAGGTMTGCRTAPRRR
jgi:hypothetical protein